MDKSEYNQKSVERVQEIVNVLTARLLAYEALRPWKVRSRGFGDMEQVFRDGEADLRAILEAFIKDDALAEQYLREAGVNVKATE